MKTLRWLSPVLAAVVVVALSGGFYPTPALAADSLPGPMASGPTEAWYGTCNHIVRPGETLTRLAGRYGTSVGELARSNYLRNPNYIWSGMALRVPCTSGYGNSGYGGYGNPGYGNSYAYRTPYSNYGNQGMGMYGMYGSPNSNYGKSYGYAAPNPYAQPAPNPYGQPAPAPQAGQGMVNIQNFAFNPGTITVRIGQQVVWVNNDSAPHTTTSGSCSGNNCTPAPGWDSGTLNPGQSFAFTFTTAGTFTYFCRIHGASMQGTVVVTQ
jgi:plastocyanin/LysM repeat protein